MKSRFKSCKFTQYLEKNDEHITKNWISFAIFIKRAIIMGKMLF